MTQIHFGVYVPTGCGYELDSIADDRDKWSVVRDTAISAERLGYDSIWLGDHFHNAPAPGHEAVFELYTALAAIAEATETIRLGGAVACGGFRSPALEAKMTSCLDVISNGRFEWGIGAGWYRDEFEAYGYPFLPINERIGRLREAVEITRLMWTEPQVTYEGQYFRLRGAQCDPKPIQKPHPPIMIGGGGEKHTLRVVAELADRAEFNLTAAPEQWAHKRDVLWAHCADVGRDPDTIELSWVSGCVVRETEAEIRELLAAGRIKQSAAGPLEPWIAANLIGTPEQVIEKINRYISMGCTNFVLATTEKADFDHTSLRLFAECVRSEFRSN